MAFKTSKMDQRGLEYWYGSFLWRLRVDGRFFHQKPILKKVNQDAAHAQKRVTVPLKGMSGAECNKTMVRGQAVVFSASPPSRLWRFTLTSRLPSLACKKREKNNTCCARYWLVENRSKKLDFLATKIGHQKNVKGAMQSYFLIHFKRLIWSSFHINSVPKTMVQFCYVRLDLGTETVSCRGLFLLMARMNMYWRLKKNGPVLPDKMIFCSYLTCNSTGTFFDWVEAVSNITLAQN